MKNLVICPTRGRPKVFKRFLDSFRKTKTISDLVIAIDFDDPTAPYYPGLRCDLGEFGLISAEKRTVTQLINFCFSMLPEYEFYTVTNDDFEFQTNGWDKELCQKGKITYGNDLMTGGVLPTTYCVDGDIVRTLGWVQLPDLSYMYGDNVWLTLGHGTNRLVYRRDIIIEHHHWSNLKASVDKTYQVTNSTESFDKDAKAYRNWLHTKKDADVRKIQSLEM